MGDLVDVGTVRLAHARIAPYTHYTPVFTSQAIDDIASSALFPDDPNIQLRLAFKGEHLQRVGAFKYRGATNSVLVHLERAKADFLASGGVEGAWDPSKLVVVTHSSGNHAAALACAAKTAGATAAVVMPENAPLPKKHAVLGYGAHVTLCKPTLEARESTAAAVIAKYEAKGCIVKFVHPYDEPLVIAGQGTMALEILDQVSTLENPQGILSSAHPTQGAGLEAQGPKRHGVWKTRTPNEPPFDIIIAPVGGGGMLSGVSSAVKGTDPRIVVIGAEPDAVNDAFHSVQANTIQISTGQSKTSCDGLLTSLSRRTLAHISKNVDTISTVREDEVLKALKLHWERQKQLVEPSAAVGLAAVLQGFNEAGRDKSSADMEDRSLWGVKRWVQELIARRRAVSASEQLDVEVRIGIVWSGGNVEVGKVLGKFEEYGL